MIPSQSAERFTNQVDFYLESLNCPSLQAPTCKMALLATVITSFVMHGPVTLTPSLGIRPTSPTLSCPVLGTAPRASMDVISCRNIDTITIVILTRFLKFLLELQLGFQYTC